MAQVLTSLLCTRTRQVFTRMPDMSREYTPVPRAIVQFNLLNGVLDAKPVNDTLELVVSAGLELRAAYRFLDFSMSVIADAANDFRAIGYMQTINAIRGVEAGGVTRHPFSVSDTTLRDNSLDEIALARFVSVNDSPRFVFQAVRPGIAPTVTWNMINLTAAACLAGTVDFYCSFLEYDIEQVEHFPLHFPLSVLNR